MIVLIVPLPNWQLALFQHHNMSCQHVQIATNVFMKVLLCVRQDGLDKECFAPATRSPNTNCARPRPRHNRVSTNTM
jgi:hypothetical protein